MLDLVYVNIIIVASDIVVVVLVYLNQLGVSHPVQNFSYALKLKLEFVVLNQLMAVAARGLKRETFEERRYHHPSMSSNVSAERRQWDDKSPIIPRKQSRTQCANGKFGSTGSTQITMPSPVLTRSNHIPSDSVSRGDDEEHTSKEYKHSSESNKKAEVDDHLEFDNEVLRGGQDPSANTWFERRTSDKGDKERIRKQPSQAFSRETLQYSATSPRSESSHLFPRPIRKLMHEDSQSTRDSPRYHGVGDSGISETTPEAATIKRRFPRKRNDNIIEEEEEEIGVHMWEKGGKLMMEVPWFKTKDGV